MPVFRCPTGRTPGGQPSAAGQIKASPFDHLRRILERTLRKACWIRKAEEGVLSVGFWTGCEECLYSAVRPEELPENSLLELDK